MHDFCMLYDIAKKRKKNCWSTVAYVGYNLGIPMNLTSFLTTDNYEGSVGYCSSRCGTENQEVQQSPSL